MEEANWPQPQWFWWVVGIYLIAEYGALVIMFLTGFTPLELFNTTAYMSFTYPIFFMIVFLLLPKKVRFKFDTIFYLLCPFIFYLPNLTMIAELINEINY